MNFFVDVESERLVDAPRGAGMVRAERKRASVLGVRVRFLRGRADVGGSAFEGLRMGFKFSYQDAGLAAEVTGWRLVDGVWVGELNLKTVAIAAALEAAAAEDERVTTVALIGELRYRDFAGHEVYLPSFTLQVGREVMTGDEGAPVVAAGVEEWLSARVVRVDKVEVLTAEERVKFFGNVGAARVEDAATKGELAAMTAAIMAEAQARSAGDADALSKTGGGTVMGGTVFAGRVQAMQAPVQLNDVPRWRDVDVVRERSKRYTIPAGQTVNITLSPADLGNRNLINGVYTGYVTLVGFYNSSAQYSARIEAAYEYWTPSLEQFTGNFNGTNTPTIKSAAETLTLSEPNIVNGLLSFTATNHNASPMPFTLVTRLYENEQ